MFSIIVAKSINNIIGINNSMPWNIPSDLKRFKELTMGKKILMGRKTFESLPCVLPGRTHLVLTTNKDFSYDHKDVVIYNDSEKLITEFKDSKEEVFVIGGGEIYSEFLDYTSKLYLTEILEEVKGDTYFSQINYSDWIKIHESNVLKENNIAFKFLDYTRKK
ncbi:dihydrofolate reductase [Clostridium perfringens]|nr:dihydrofolate reductase [Clostridium perfringens]